MVQLLKDLFCYLGLHRYRVNHHGRNLTRTYRHVFLKCECCGNVRVKTYKLGKQKGVKNV